MSTESVRVLETDNATGEQRYVINMASPYSASFTRQQAEAAVAWRKENITGRYSYEIVPAEPNAGPVIVRAEQTCFACPAQWDAWDADGTQYYLRYRHSFGSAEIRRTADGEWLDSNPERVAEFETDEQDGGVISLEEFCERAGLELRLA